MHKAERMFVDQVPGVGFNRSKAEMSQKDMRMRAWLTRFLLRKGYILFIIGILFGRAFILESLTPFILPFFASVFWLRRKHAPLALIGLIAGAATVSFTHAVYTFSMVFLFLVLFRTMRWLFDKDIQAIPVFVFVSIYICGLAKEYFVLRSISTHEVLFVGIEAGLGLVLTLIFFQCVPLIMVKNGRQTLRTEEIISLIILLASVLTGTIGLALYDLSIDQILSRYLVLVFAFIAGAALGSTAGLITGLVFLLASITSFDHLVLLSLGGLLGGLLKEGKKIGAAVGLLIATLLIGIYGQGDGFQLYITMFESAAAIVLFFLTPQVFISHIAKYFPGTNENAVEQLEYMRKVRDITSLKVERFSKVFKTLAESFSYYEEKTDEEDQELTDLLTKVTAKSCEICFLCNRCWRGEEKAEETIGMMTKVVKELDRNGGRLSTDFGKEWAGYCSKSDKVIKLIEKELPIYQAKQKLKRQVIESRKLVADQLMAVSKIMDDFAKDMVQERENHNYLEEEIIDALQDLGVKIEDIEIYSLEKGNIDLDVYIPYCNGYGDCEKVIAPMLSDILGETVLVTAENCAEHPGGFCHATFRSAKAFKIETGVAYVAKGGGFLSGDNYTSIEVSGGKHAIAISDGMGNGERAHKESKATLQLLKKILQSGIEEKVAVKSINSVLSLRTTDEMYSTLDLALIDLQNGNAKYLKIGSSPSFVKRGNKVKKIHASNLPIGILHDIEVDEIDDQLKAGDILIMMSDGIFEGPKHVENFDLWMKRKIGELETNDPQEIADLILEEVIRSGSGAIEDDMTVVVAKIEHNTPKWTTIPVRKFRKKA